MCASSFFFISAKLARVSAWSLVEKKQVSFARLACLYVIVCVVVFQNANFEGKNRRRPWVEQQHLFCQQTKFLFSRVPRWGHCSKENGVHALCTFGGRERFEKDNISTVFTHCCWCSFWWKRRRRQEQRCSLIDGCETLMCSITFCKSVRYWQTSLGSRQTTTITEIFHFLSKSRKSRSQTLQRARRAFPTRVASGAEACLSHDCHGFSRFFFSSSKEV